MVDFPRLQKGGLRAQFWSVYVDWYVTLAPLARLHTCAKLAPHC